MGRIFESTDDVLDKKLSVSRLLDEIEKQMTEQGTLGVSANLEWGGLRCALGCLFEVVPDDTNDAVRCLTRNLRHRHAHGIAGVIWRVHDRTADGVDKSVPAFMARLRRAVDRIRRARSWEAVDRAVELA